MDMLHEISELQIELAVAKAELAAAKAELAACREDAERYRWLRASCPQGCWWSPLAPTEDLSIAIDAARKEGA